MTVPQYATPITTALRRTRDACVILSAGRSPESKDLRTDHTAIVPEMRRPFNSFLLNLDDRLAKTSYSTLFYPEIHPEKFLQKFLKKDEKTS